MDERPDFDLQSHSTHSDGALAPGDVVAAAAAAGVRTLALTDHDSTLGVAEARKAAHAAGVTLIPAVEITASHGARRDLHVLGYLVDPDEPALTAALAHSRGDRERRAHRMAAALRELGYALDESVLEARSASGGAVGRPHLAQAVVAHPDNRERLADKGLTDPTDFLVAYLIEGTPAFRPREAPSVAVAIELIHAAGGIAVWAHPFWDVDSPDEVLSMVREFRDAGLDGTEAFYVTHTAEQTRLLVERTGDLLTTGSADFHGPDHARFSEFRAFELHGLEPRLGPLADLVPS